MDPGDSSVCQNFACRAAMVIPYPPRPHRLVGEVLNTNQITNALIKILMSRLQTVREDVGALSNDKRAGWSLHSFLSHLVLGVNPAPGLDQLSLLGVNQEGTVHLLH